MSEEKFTQGEWAIHYNSADAIEVTLGGGNGWDGENYLCIGVIAGGSYDIDAHNNPEALADAHLISAAPNMHREIRGDIKRLEREAKQHALGSYELKSINSQLSRKRAILAKADGDKTND